ncbi:MAG: polynucleotide kinase-phosphatase [Planctomycetes bacterium]|nr:polynucleotide kinase-phosphatase [Planctomycetota bacterium]
MNVSVPELALVVLVGPSGSGKSTFARKHFAPTEVLSSDACRAMVADDENDQAATKPAFEVLHFIAKQRLAAGRLTVIDATNVQAEARAPLVALAREHDCLPVAIVLDLDEGVCHERNRSRPDRAFGPHVVRQHKSQLRRALRSLKDEGFRQVIVLRTPEEVESVVLERARLYNDRRDDAGPFDVIGDVHGCFDELVELLRKLGWEVDAEAPSARPPEGRKAVFLGDLVDRGPNSPGVLRLVMRMVADGTALCVPGNHDMKLLRKLRGKDVRITHGLAETLEQLGREPAEFHTQVASFLDGLVSHYVLDGGRLVVAHAGLKEAYQGRASGRVREFCMYGETTGETDEYGLPVRHDWASEYRGAANVVYGHTPTPEARWVNRTLCIDTGCVFGGRLSALRHPERELVDVEARREYYAPVKPLRPPEEVRGDVLDANDVFGKRIVETRVFRTVTIREENAAAAIEVMSRFAVDPRWLVYLPPTMSPSETCASGELLEHPREAFAYFRAQNVERVICQEKHMGSRAVVVLARDVRCAERRFGANDGRSGVVVTRTGRPFFADRGLEARFLDRMRVAFDAAGFWDEFATDWACIDGELLPWSAKAGALLEQQYAPVGSAASAGLARAAELARTSAARGVETAELAVALDARLARVRSYVAAYRRYCWRVDDLDGLELAPFHLLATEGRVHADRDHVWHMGTLGRLVDAGGRGLRRTRTQLVHLADPESERAATAWWEELTTNGGEGMVVKPLDWIVRGEKGLVQPALKCRGREYLRIIYGPEYDAPEHIERLRARGLSSTRSLALREYALGLEALYRFVEREPLHRVHECVFGVLALESEPVDPRL